jgi:hypothetical protein
MVNAEYVMYALSVMYCVRERSEVNPDESISYGK